MGKPNDSVVRVSDEAYDEIGLFGFRILNGIGNNIRCGNSLVESDILDFFPALLNRENELLRTNIFDWNSAEGFQPIFSLKGGFDYIIGNPPYVEVKNYNVDLPIMHQYIKNTYESSKNGKVDLAIPFIEKAMNLLNSNGKLGLIIQKRFFKTDYGKAIRNLITRSNYLYSIIDFETTSIFKDRLTYSVVVEFNPKFKIVDYVIKKSIINSKRRFTCGKTFGTL